LIFSLLHKVNSHVLPLHNSSHVVKVTLTMSLLQMVPTLSSSRFQHPLKV